VTVLWVVLMVVALMALFWLVARRRARRAG
jgi:hypothetical protein